MGWVDCKVKGNNISYRKTSEWIGSVAVFEYVNVFQAHCYLLVTLFWCLRSEVAFTTIIDCLLVARVINVRFICVCWRKGGREVTCNGAVCDWCALWHPWQCLFLQVLAPHLPFASVRHLLLDSLPWSPVGVLCFQCWIYRINSTLKMFVALIEWLFQTL